MENQEREAIIVVEGLIHPGGV